MSLFLCGIPILECVYCLACARWAWKRCLHTAGHDSENWGLASPVDFEPVPRLCRLILAVYEEDLHHPLWAPPGGYGIDPDWVVRRKTYEDTQGQAPPYLIYIDHKNSDIVLAIRGFNLKKESDYAVLLDNKLGQRKFDGGYVHNGLLEAAGWVLDQECEILRELAEHYPNYMLTFTGHSLGSGVAALLTMVVVHNLDRLGNIDRKRVRCFAIAPARCMSLNLAVRYADVINSVVLQMKLCSEIQGGSMHRVDFITLLRESHSGDTHTRGKWKRSAIKGLIGREDFLGMELNREKIDVNNIEMILGRFPPLVRTAVPVDGRFEHIVLSCNATSDHAIIWIEREAQRALDLMMEKENTMEIPATQRMERQETLRREHSEEHKAALRRAVMLAVPDAYFPSTYGTFEDDNGERSGRSRADSIGSSRKGGDEASWDEVM
ncbi:hypothetical protein ACLOJK_024417 [Asimina triloba]